jgi:GxxExxY protein
VQSGLDGFLPPALSSGAEDFSSFQRATTANPFVFNQRGHGIGDADLSGMPNAIATQLNQITRAIIGAAIRVHKALGPGLLESVYLASLVFEPAKAGFVVETQKGVPVSYRGVRLDCGFRADIIVNGSVVVEVKSVERLAPIHDAQMMTYLRLSGCRVGLILNFNAPLMIQGIKRVVCDFPEEE